MSSITIARTGDVAYQSSIWDDGVLRYDGSAGTRLGAWQTQVPSTWFDRLRELLEELPKVTRGRTGAGWTVTLDAGRAPRTHGISAETADVPTWRLLTSFEGVLSLSRWSPLDDSGRYDLSWFAGSVPIEFRQVRVVAEGLATGQGVVVLAGSVASTSTSESLEPTYKALREQFSADGSFALVEDRYVLTRHLFFDKPSAAASVLAGSNTNGRVKWTSKSGTAWGSLGLD
jgi:hypothetical protein